MLFYREIYTFSKKFTLPPAVPAVTNLTSVWVQKHELNRIWNFSIFTFPIMHDQIHGWIEWWLLSGIYNKNAQFFRQFLPPFIPILSDSFSLLGSFMTVIDKEKIIQMKQWAIIDKPNHCLCSAHKIVRSYFSFITSILGCLLLALKPIYAFEGDRQGLSDSWVDWGL